MLAIILPSYVRASKGCLSTPLVRPLNYAMSRWYHLRFFLILFIFIALVIGIELAVSLLLGNQTLTPLLSVVVLAGLAYFFSFRQVLLAIPLFTCLSYFMIRNSSEYPLVRSSTVLVGGIVALWASRQRSRLSSQVEEVEAVLQSLPVPWILSDASGVITRHSAKLAEFSDVGQEIVGASFFSYFNLTSNKDFIRSYMDSFEKKFSPPTIRLIPAAFSKSFWISFHFLSYNSGRHLLSILNENNPESS